MGSQLKVDLSSKNQISRSAQVSPLKVVLHRNLYQHSSFTHSPTAISRRMQTDKGGQQGPRSTRDAPTPMNGSRYRQPEGRGTNNRDSNNVGAPPSVPGFGFQFPMPNGMPMFPPGFMMPGSTPAQPPPPGAT